MAFDRERIAFGPEALSRFTQIIEEVAAELVGDGVPAALVRSNKMRTRLAQRLLGFARFWWTDAQIKQLMLRTLRNEVSASRIYATVAGVETRAEKLKQNTSGWWAIQCAYLGVDKSQAIWRKSVRAPGPRASSAE